MSDASGAHVPMMRVWLDHVGDEAFNLAAEPQDADYAAMNFPVLTGTGFFDDDQPGALRYYARHGAHAPPRRSRAATSSSAPGTTAARRRPRRRSTGSASPRTRYST